MLQTMGQTFQEMLAGRISPQDVISARRPTGRSTTRSSARLARWRPPSTGVGAPLRRARVARGRGGRRAEPRVRVRAPGEPRKVAYLYLAPAFFFYLLFAFGPLVYTAWLSFFDWDGLTVGDVGRPGQLPTRC